MYCASLSVCLPVVRCIFLDSLDETRTRIIKVLFVFSIGCKLKIIHEDDHMLVVDKPPSIPVHPCGRYRHNSIIFLLAKEFGVKKIHTIHRLDRLTSGILMFAKSLERSQFMSSQIRSLAVQKEYLCRVEGEFPVDEVEVSEPIEVFSNKIGVCGVGREGKACTTLFKRLSFNGKSSVVLAKPKQGRMHQIRVHLQYLGHPIVNDSLYNDVVSRLWATSTNCAPAMLIYSTGIDIY